MIDFTALFETSNPPPTPFEDSMIPFLVRICIILAVNGSGESISFATSFIPTLIPFDDLVAINIEALIPYSQAFENIDKFVD